MLSGRFSINELTESVFGLDGGAMFGIVPKPLWSRVYPADEKNRIDMAARIFLISSGDRNIIIETGMGNKYDEKQRNIYNIRNNDLDELLSRFSLTKDKITDVILSHLHFDHAGGLTKREGNHIVLLYPNAKIYVQRSQLENALNPSIKDRGSYIRDDFEFLTTYNKAVLLDGDYEVMDGVRIKPLNGHTQGMQIVFIDTGDHNFIFTADLIPTARHIKIPYVMAYDLRPLETIEEKRCILNYAVKNDSILLFPHDVFTPAARVRENNGDFDIKEEVRL